MGFNLVANTGHRCGECSLCCKLLPTDGVTPYNTRCQHQRMTGCRLYPHHPIACRAFTCMWLAGNDNEGLKRPDRGHYVVSSMPDMIRLQRNDTGEIEAIPVLEIWLDPNHPNAHRDTGLRAYLERRGKDGFLGLVRETLNDAFVLFPPAGQYSDWREARSNCSVDKSWSHAERVEALGLKIEIEGDAPMEELADEACVQALKRASSAR